jgi:hypothetical protein
MARMATTDFAGATTPSRRLLPRYRADIRVRVALSTPVPVILHARAADLSTSGMSIVLPQPDLSEAISVVGLKVPGSDAYLWIPVRLRHHSGFRCGFEFVELSLEQRGLVRRLCAALSA